MDTLAVANETTVRLGFFFGVFLLVALAERLWPRRAATVPRLRRWIDNLSVTMISSVFVRLVLPLGEVAFALLAAQKGWGLFNLIELPLWLEVLISVLALDLLIYFQHRMLHAVPLLWRLHSMHHADLDFDLSTGSRFHPIEILLSVLIKIAAIALLGASATAVLIFAVLLNGIAVFNHSNLRLPLPLDALLRRILVTPDMHRVHHSILVEETNSNFGFNLPWWDRLLGTYRAQPALGHQGMSIGLAQHRDPKRLTLPWLIAFPFLRRT